MRKSHNGKLEVISIMLWFLFSISCTGPNWNADQTLEPYTVSSSNMAVVLEPEPEDVPYFKAIADDQEKQLGLCKEKEACRGAHFLPGPGRII